MINLTIVPTPMVQQKWLKRAGVFGFWFFLLKGILWMAAPLVFYYLA